MRAKRSRKYEIDTEVKEVIAYIVKDVLLLGAFGIAIVILFTLL